MSQVILDSQGVIDKYQGDGIMAFWGAPISLEDHAASVLLNRCEDLQNHAPASDWDGVFRLKQK
jgi:adenylate cyclase